LLLGCEAFEVGRADLVEAPDADRGYLDRYFTAWVDPAKLKLLNCATLAELLIAYVDDAHAAGDARALKILDRRAMVTSSRRNVVRL
jgi:hypothetical protein